jgi:ubiquinone/menaquinone biosynthesis C-methylase UbiE
MVADSRDAVRALVRRLELQRDGAPPPLVLDANQTELPLPYADQSVEAVVVAGPLERTADPVAWAREIRRVLRPGGRALALAPDAGRWVWDDPELRRPYTRKSLRMLFADHQFSVRESGYRSLSKSPLRAALDHVPGRPRLTWVLALRP